MAAYGADVKDTSDAMCFMLEQATDKINGQVLNVGSDANNYQMKTLAEKIAATLPKEISIGWYGDVDKRSYRVSFEN